jgi:dTDP-4-dehydrorhamnose reductase
VVIIENIELQNKIMEFNVENGLKEMAKDPTPKYQKYVKEIDKKCKTIIDKPSQYRYIQMNPQAPKLNILIKLHKERQPIRPVDNYRGVPTYKIAKFMAEWLEQNLDLLYAYNITSTSKSAENIKKLVA